MQAPSCIERFARLWTKHRRRWKCLLEVLIVDDGSTDNTAEVARELALAYPSVHLVLLHKNGGPAKARNAGLDVARREWVAVLDADDAFMPERLERLTRAASDLNADVVLDNFAWYDATKNSVGSPGISPSSTVEVIDKYEFAMRARPYTDEADWGSLHYTGRASGLSRTRIDYDTMAAQTSVVLGYAQLRTDNPSDADRLLDGPGSPALRVAESSAMVRLAVHSSPKNGLRPRGGLLLRTRD